MNVDSCIEKLKRKELLDEIVIRELCEKAKEILVNEKNVRSVQAPVTLVGDIHG